MFKAVVHTVAQPPHPVLERYYVSERERSARVNEMFDAAAADYDRIESAMSLGSGKRYRRIALTRAGLAAGMHVLDVGCGTGVLAQEAARIVGAHGSVSAIDPSSGMLAQARGRQVTRAVQGVGERLPFADASFDLLCMGYALRHVADLNVAFREFRRVLKPDGIALLLEITAPKTPTAHTLLKLYLKHFIPAISRLSRRGRAASRLMSYYWETVESCVPPAVIVDALRAAGFERIERRVQVGVFSAYQAVSRTTPSAARPPLLEKEGRDS